MDYVEMQIAEKKEPAPLGMPAQLMPLYLTLWDATAEAPKTREELATATGLNDRTVREQVKELRRRGIRVISTSKTAGYYIDRSGEDYQRMRAEMKARALDILTTIARMDSAPLPRQITL